MYVIMEAIDLEVLAQRLIVKTWRTFKHRRSRGIINKRSDIENAYNDDFSKYTEMFKIVDDIDQEEVSSELWPFLFPLGYGRWCTFRSLLNWWLSNGSFVDPFTRVEYDFQTIAYIEDTLRTFRHTKSPAIKRQIQEIEKIKTVYKATNTHKAYHLSYIYGNRTRYYMRCEEIRNVFGIQTDRLKMLCEVIEQVFRVPTYISSVLGRCFLSKLFAQCLRMCNMDMASTYETMFTYYHGWLSYTLRYVANEYPTKEVELAMKCLGIRIIYSSDVDTISGTESSIYIRWCTSILRAVNFFLCFLKLHTQKEPGMVRLFEQRETLQSIEQIDRVAPPSMLASCSFPMMIEDIDDAIMEVYNEKSDYYDFNYAKLMFTLIFAARACPS